MTNEEIEKLRELLIKFVPDFNHETDCYEKWMESVQDDVRDLLNGYWTVRDVVEYKSMYSIN